MKNIVLIGFMGCGKSTFGKLIAKKLGYEFLDTDDVIEKTEKMKISDIFSKEGEEYFRKCERNICKSLALENNKIIATGGGIIKSEENIEMLKLNGIILYLKADAHKIFENVNKSNIVRPLLEKEDKMGEIVRLLAQRTPLYEKYAQITVDVNGSIEESTNKILTALRGEI